MFTIAGLNAGPNLRNFWGEPIGTLKRLKKIKFCFFKIIVFWISRATQGASASCLYKKLFANINI